MYTENNKIDTSKADWQLINFCESDRFASQSYCAVHGVSEDLNLGDITKVEQADSQKPFNMICGGTPCQDLSIAGKQKGIMWKCNNCNYEYNPLEIHFSKRSRCPKCKSEEIDKTRSSLLIEYLRVIRENEPSWGIWENVKNAIGKKYKLGFDLFLKELDEYGYNTYYKVLNAKDFGIPQNRERVFLVFIKKELDNGKFKFPEGFDNGIRLKDVLEDEVQEKFYVRTDRTEKLLKELIEDGKLKEYEK